MEPGHIYIHKERNLKPLAWLLLFFLAGSVFLAYFTDKRTQIARSNFYFVPPLKYVSFIGATHKSFFAYLFFIRGILDISEPFPSSANRMDCLLGNFRIAARLEPQLTRAYFFGAVVVPRTREDIEKGIGFLEEAARLKPGDWRIPFWMGLAHMELGDYKKTVQCYRQAAALPDCPAYIKTNLAFLYYRADEIDEGVLYLQSLILSLDDKRIINMIQKKLDWLKDIVFLEGKVRDFRQKFGKWPVDLEELQVQGLIGNIPEDTFGRGYYLEPDPAGGRPEVKSKWRTGEKGTSSETKKNDDD